MSGQQQQGRDSASDYGWGLAMIGIAAFVIWHFGHTGITKAFLAVKQAEIAVINLLIHSPRLSELADGIRGADATRVKFGELHQVAGIVGSYLRWVFAPALFIAGVMVMRAATLDKFKKSYSMNDLAETEQEVWPFISPVAGKDIIGQKLHEGPWAMSPRPHEFCRQFKLHNDDKSLNRDRAMRVFIQQLGPLWAGHKRLPDYVQALFAVFITRINGEVDEKGHSFNPENRPTVRFLEQLAMSAATGKIDTTGMEAFIADGIKTKKVQKIISRHAYVLTVMSQLLLEARKESGVLASAEFLWLKPLNRRLWYTLNNVGRDTPFPEVGGIHAHWLAERMRKRAIIRPMVGPAVDGLEEELGRIVEDEDD